MSEITGTLNNWAAGTIYTAINEYIIWGDVTNDIHRRFRDGTYIHTSGINLTDYPIDDLEEGMVVKTRNSAYLLGKPKG